MLILEDLSMTGLVPNPLLVVEDVICDDAEDVEDVICDDVVEDVICDDVNDAGDEDDDDNDNDNNLDLTLLLNLYFWHALVER